VKSSDLTIILSRRECPVASKYKMSRGLLWTLGVALVVLVSSFSMSTLHYFYMWKKTANYDRLRLESDALRGENEILRLSTRQLGEKISNLEINSKKLEFLSISGGEKMGSTGGPSNAEDFLTNLNGRGLIRHFRSLTRRSITLAKDLRNLKERYNTRSILLVATPNVMPVKGYPSGHYGYRTDPFTAERDFHPGMDISAPLGTKVIATADGLILFAGRESGYGRLVSIEHKFGVSTRYGHLHRILVKKGQRVNRNDVIGYVGSTGRATGPHLHYEVRLNGQPLNPLRFFQGLG